MENPGLWLEAARRNGHGASGLATLRLDGWTRPRAMEIGLFQASPQSTFCLGDCKSHLPLCPSVPKPGPGDGQASKTIAGPGVIGRPAQYLNYPSPESSRWMYRPTRLLLAK